MLGAVIGDIAASRFWARPGPVPADCVIWHEDAHITAASVGVVAAADALLEGDEDFAPHLKKWALAYPEIPRPPEAARAAFAAARAAPAGWAAESAADVLRLAARQTAADSAFGADAEIRTAAEAAVAFASACWMARQGGGRRLVRDSVQGQFGYDLSGRYDTLVAETETAPNAHAAPGPHAAVRLGLLSALWAESVEEAVKNALRLGGGPTCGPRAMTAGALAQALYGLESAHQNQALDRLGGKLESAAMLFRAHY